MLHIQVICCGRLKEKHYIDACHEYLKRLTPLAKTEVLELPELPSRPGSILLEGERILSVIPQGAMVVALCVEGRMMPSEALAQSLRDWQNRGISRIVFVIGSSEGLSDPVKARADLKLSLSPMTFPHHLARVMVLEQIYRALDILRGGKYHK